MSTLLPFLYRTRTLQSLTRSPLRRQIAHSTRKPARSPARRPYEPSHDAIPFEGPIEGVTDDATSRPSTITPTEADVFKSIFDDIAQGKIKPKRQRPRLDQESELSAQSSTGSPTSSSLVEQARQSRLTDFRDHALQRYPDHLRQAAQVALNLYEFSPGNSAGEAARLEQAEEDQKLRQQRLKFDELRETARERLQQKMQACTTPQKLWALLEQQIFTLPAKLGIVDGGRTTQSTKRKSDKIKTDTGAMDKSKTEKYSMDVYGPLYPDCILTALEQFSTAWPQPSPFIFQILPKLKSIGLPSYVLGASTALYARLARMHWDFYGDASSALDMVDEMNSIGLQPDVEVHDLLVRIKDELHACASGSQGEFVAAMMESPPYDASLLERIDYVERYVRRSLFITRGEDGG